MKHLKITLIVAGLCCCLLAIAAPSGLAPAQITFRVIDDEGAPVSGAVIDMSTFQNWKPGESFGRDAHQTFVGETDKEGLLVLKGASRRGDFSFGPHAKDGYYGGGGGKIQFTSVKSGRWEPWNPTISIVMKRILNPIPMYAKNVGVHPLMELPSSEESGFDLMEGDWVAPHGRGKIADLLFRVEAVIPVTDPAQRFEYVFSVKFSNPGDGIQSVPVPPGQTSVLRLPRFAPESGYESGVARQMGRAEPGKPMYPTLSEDQNYFLRVRTVLDENGKIKSALYGKILGEISCDVINSPRGLLRFKYCLNPTSLDRNMEFDPARNLFGRLPFSQRVTQP